MVVDIDGGGGNVEVKIAPSKAVKDVITISLGNRVVRKYPLCFSVFHKRKEVMPTEKDFSGCKDVKSRAAAERQVVQQGVGKKL